MTHGGVVEASPQRCKKTIGSPEGKNRFQAQAAGRLRPGIRCLTSAVRNPEPPTSASLTYPQKLSPRHGTISKHPLSTVVVTQPSSYLHCMLRHGIVEAISNSHAAEARRRMAAFLSRPRITRSTLPPREAKRPKIYRAFRWQFRNLQLKTSQLLLVPTVQDM